MGAFGKALLKSHFSCSVNNGFEGGQEGNQEGSEMCHQRTGGERGRGDPSEMN